MSDPFVTAIRGLLDSLDHDLGNKFNSGMALITENTRLTEERNHAVAEAEALQRSIADTEPRAAVRYYTASGYVKMLSERRLDQAYFKSLSQALGMRATKVGQERGILPVEIESSATQNTMVKACPLPIWDAALAAWNKANDY